MLLRFSKHTHKSPTLTCIREDGSQTYFRSENQGDFFAIHDLCHYAVETTLGYTQAFYGLVAAGREITDFGTQNGQKDTREYSPEAFWTEVIAGRLTATATTNSLISYAEIIEAIQVQCEKDTLPLPQLSEEKFLAAQELAKKLTATWKSLPDDKILELTF